MRGNTSRKTARGSLAAAAGVAEAALRVPGAIRDALQDALEIATENVPSIPGKVYVCPDVSGSMRSAVTGHRGSATSAVQCVDVAGLVAASILRRNPNAEVIAFSDDVVTLPRPINPRDSVMTNAQYLASLPSGGTACSAPLRYLNARGDKGDLVVYVSDNQSWADFARKGNGPFTRGTLMKGAIDALFALGDNEAVIGRAPAGAGKSYAIGTTVEAARARGMRVAVATPTNEQAFALVSTLADRLPRETVTFVRAQHVLLPEDHERKNVTAPDKAREAVGAKLVVGTLNKLGDAFARADLRPFDVLLIDEGFQANAVHYYLVGGLAPRHFLMGDSGQLTPFTSAPDGDRWRGLSEDPLLTAVEVLRRNHPKTREFPLPISRRLDPRAVPVARAFYPDHPFESAILPGVRELRLAARDARKDRLFDAALDMAKRRVGAR